MKLHIYFLFVELLCPLVNEFFGQQRRQKMKFYILFIFFELLHPLVEGIVNYDDYPYWIDLDDASAVSTTPKPPPDFIPIDYDDITDLDDISTPSPSPPPSPLPSPSPSNGSVSQIGIVGKIFFSKNMIYWWNSRQVTVDSHYNNILEIVLIVLGVPLGFGILILLCLACKQMCDRRGFHRLEDEEPLVIELNQNRFGIVEHLSRMARYVPNWFDQNMRFCPYCFLSYFSRWYRFTCRRHGNPPPLGNIELNLIGDFGVQLGPPEILPPTFRDLITIENENDVPLENGEEEIVTLENGEEEIVSPLLPNQLSSEIQILPESFSILPSAVRFSARLRERRNTMEETQLKNQQKADDIDSSFDEKEKIEKGKEEEEKEGESSKTKKKKGKRKGKKSRAKK